MSSPEGLLIGKSSKPWKIGRLLGSGACGSVHELLAPTGSSSTTTSSKKKSPIAYAIKIARLPPSKPMSKAGKKRKKTAEERNADLITHEHITLQKLSEMRGTMVPDIPYIGTPPAYGETADSKFRFLVMERMAAPLSNVVPILLKSHGKAKGVSKVPMGDVAVAMLDCIEGMHEKGLLFIDVKSENFMLSSAASEKGKKASNNNDVSQRVRLIDFGLVELYGDMTCSKQREDMHPDAALVGTPTYASLNVMKGHTVSRRDDLEALGYVVAELILLFAILSSNKKDDNHVLPWSNAASDDELYNIKLHEMDKSKRSKSKLFAGLKAAGSDTVMGNFFSAVRDLGYAEKPDYDALRRCLKKLVVTVESNGTSSGGAKKATSAAKKAPARRKSARRNHVDDEDSDDSIEIVDENVENSKSTGKKPKVSVAKESVARRSTRSKKAVQTREISTQTDDLEVVDIDSSDDEDQMDWESVSAPDENIEPACNEARGKGILKLDIIEGPHRGEEICFGGDHPGTVLVGGEAESRAAKDVTKFSLEDDDAASGVLAKVVLTSKKNLHSVRVTDMSYSEGILVKNSSLPKGKSRQAFVGDKIKIGESILQIRKVQ